jgi:DNA adenine methylase
MSMPPFAYFGGKTSTAARIVGRFPPHGHYVEPFAGSLAVLLAKPPSLMETVNDLDGDLMVFWRMLRDQPAELARVCQLTPHSRAEWESSADLDVSDPLERARRVWVRLTQGRSGRLLRTGWRHYVAQVGVGTAFPSYLDGYVDRMAAAAQRLHHVTLECRPALEIIERYGAGDDVLIYADPPYLGSARGSYDKGYRHEMRDEQAHRDLAAALHRCRATVVLSGYASDLYDLELYPDWHRTTFVSGTGHGVDGGSNRTEVLWSNRAATPDLFTIGEASA